MQIAVTCQNRRSITQHAGKCRNFWIYKIEKGAVAGKRLIELASEQSFHASHYQLAEPLAEINVVITASMGAGLHRRLKQAGIQPVITWEDDPDQAVKAYLDSSLEHQAPAPGQHCHGHGPHHGH